MCEVVVAPVQDSLLRYLVNRDEQPWAKQITYSLGFGLKPIFPTAVNNQTAAVLLTPDCDSAIRFMLQHRGLSHQGGLDKRYLLAIRMRTDANLFPLRGHHLIDHGQRDDPHGLKLAYYYLQLNASGARDSLAAVYKSILGKRIIGANGLHPHGGADFLFGNSEGAMCSLHVVVSSIQEAQELRQRMTRVPGVIRAICFAQYP
jgi:hypothetical protein